jgi:biotin synthase
MPIDRSDILAVLHADGSEREDLFQSARQLRGSVFGDRVLIRAVCEVTNLCRVDCEFCPMRRSNTRHNDIYQQTPDELVAAARVAYQQDVNVICFQGGEIPQTTNTVLAALPAVRALYRGGVDVLLNLGNKSHAEYAALREAGATSYIIKHETSDVQLNAAMRHETLDSRLERIRDLLSLGYRVGTGTIVGLPGQSLESIADDIVLARELGVHMCSASPFVPAPDTPLANCPPGDVELTLNVLAAMRLANPAWGIPSVSALSKLAERGQLRGLLAGANVMNFNATAAQHRDRYLIYGKDRKVAEHGYVRDTIAEAGLHPGRSPFVVLDR